MYICGIDEAGRGPLAGPVITAAVVFSEGIRIEGVRDSKKLSPAKRDRFYDLILEACAGYRIERIGNKEIDDINILKATMRGMQKCLKYITSDKLSDELKIFIDGNYLRFEDGSESKYSYETVVKGDEKIFEVSCASILAKVTRDRLMTEYDKIYTHYNFRNNKGYGTKEHIAAIKEFGLCDIHRLSFTKNFIQDR
ncbi:MAG: ribonuclease HII [Ignavibacteriae bacterium]|jgi:ribonuclease HII|nr:ribonuclease HII [Ignavibacteriota bacterium]